MQRVRTVFSNIGDTHSDPSVGSRDSSGSVLGVRTVQSRGGSSDSSSSAGPANADTPRPYREPRVFPFAFTGAAQPDEQLGEVAGAYANIYEINARTVMRGTNKYIASIPGPTDFNNTSATLLALGHYSVAYPPVAMYATNIAHALAYNARMDSDRGVTVDVLYPRMDTDLFGISIERRLTRPAGSPANLAAGIDVARQVCNSVATLHERGCTHNDIKPGNFLVYKDPNRAVPMYGVLRDAPAQGGPTHAQSYDVLMADMDEVDMRSYAGKPAASVRALTGTPEYMAPEVWSDFTIANMTHPHAGSPNGASDTYVIGVKTTAEEQTDEAGDLWALGCTLYGVFTGGWLADDLMGTREEPDRMRMASEFLHHSLFSVDSEKHAPLPKDVLHHIKERASSNTRTTKYISTLFASRMAKAVACDCTNARIREHVGARLRHAFAPAGAGGPACADHVERIVASVITSLLNADKTRRMDARTACTLLAGILEPQRVSSPASLYTFKDAARRSKWTALSDPMFNPIASLRGDDVRLFAGAVDDIRAAGCSGGGGAATLDAMAADPRTVSSQMRDIMDERGAPNNGRTYSLFAMSAVASRMYTAAATIIAATHTWAAADAYVTAVVAVALESGGLLSEDAVVRILVCMFRGARGPTNAATWAQAVLGVLNSGVAQRMGFNVLTASPMTVLTLARDFAARQPGAAPPREHPFNDADHANQLRAFVFRASAHDIVRMHVLATDHFGGDAASEYATAQRVLDFFDRTARALLE